MPRRLTKEQHDYIVSHLNDYPRKDVAKKAGIMLHTLYKYINLYGGKKLNNKLDEDTIKRIKDMYPSTMVKEISLKLGIPQSTINCLAKRLSLSHNEETKRKINDIRNKSLRQYWNKERYSEKGRKQHIKYKMEELRVMSGLPQNTKLRLRALSPNTLNAKMYLRKVYNYFYSSGEPLVLCFDKETRRNKKEEYYTKKYGFQFVEAEK